PDSDESTVVDSTTKVLALVESDVPVVSGCDEAVGETSVVDQDPASPSHDQTISFRVQEPLGGIGTCRLHREFGFQPLAPQCYYELATLWRTDTRQNSPLAEPVLAGPLNTHNAQAKPALSGKASDFIAKKMCQATPNDRLTMLAVGPSTNVARALRKIQSAPK